jgi:hypothetical protein
VVAPEIEVYQFVDSEGYPEEDQYPGQRLPAQGDPNWISPNPGCFGLGTLLYATLRYATLRYATLRYATLRYATLRYSTLLYATLGEGRMATRAGRITINTKSLETFARVYEFMVVIQKGERRAKAKIELEVGEIPAPINEIACISQSLCFPGFGGIYVNPTSRLALIGNCQDLCNGHLSYEWTIENANYDVKTVSK